MIVEQSSARPGKSYPRSPALAMVAMTSLKKVAANRVNGRKSRVANEAGKTGFKAAMRTGTGLRHLTPRTVPYRARSSSWWMPSAMAMTIRSCASRRWRLQKASCGYP